VTSAIVQMLTACVSQTANYAHNARTDFKDSAVFVFLGHVGLN